MPLVAARPRFQPHENRSSRFNNCCKNFRYCDSVVVKISDLGSFVLMKTSLLSERLEGWREWGFPSLRWGGKIFPHPLWSIRRQPEFCYLRLKVILILSEAWKQVSVYGRSGVTIVLRAAGRRNRHRMRITLQDTGAPPVNRLVDPIGPGIHLESCGIVACAHTACLDCVLTVSWLRLDCILTAIIFYLRMVRFGLSSAWRRALILSPKCWSWEQLLQRWRKPSRHGAALSFSWEPSLGDALSSSTGILLRTPSAIRPPCGENTFSASREQPLQENSFYERTASASLAPLCLNAHRWRTHSTTHHLFQREPFLL